MRPLVLITYRLLQMPLFIFKFVGWLFLTQNTTKNNVICPALTRSAVVYKGGYWLSMRSNTVIFHNGKIVEVYASKYIQEREQITDFQQCWL